MFNCSAHKYLFSVLLSAFLLTSCTTTTKITQDYKTGTDFASYKTFSWHNFSTEIKTGNQLAVQRMVEQQLALQGLQLVSEMPDLVLDLNIIQHAATPSSTGVGVSIGLPIGRHGAVGLGTNKLLSKGANLTGLIILDVTAQKANQVIWRGSADNISLDTFLLKNQTELNKILINLIRQFPPKS